MMVDLAPTHRRGIAAGINEFMGYLGVSLLTFLTGLLASSYGLGPIPFYLGLGVAVIGFLMSLTIKETHKPKLALQLRWVNGVGLPSLLGFMTNLKDEPGMVVITYTFINSRVFTNNYWFSGRFLSTGLG